MNPVPGPLTDEQLAEAFDLIAEAVDRAGPEREAELLARLALALTARLASVDDLKSAIRAAEQAVDELQGNPQA
jgi:hypothetical protein